MDILTYSKKLVILNSTAQLLTCNQIIKGWKQKQPSNLPFGICKKEKVWDRTKW